MRRAEDDEARALRPRHGGRESATIAAVPARKPAPWSVFAMVGGDDTRVLDGRGSLMYWSNRGGSRVKGNLAAWLGIVRFIGKKIPPGRTFRAKRRPPTRVICRTGTMEHVDELVEIGRRFRVVDVLDQLEYSLVLASRDRRPLAECGWLPKDTERLGRVMAALLPRRAARLRCRASVDRCRRLLPDIWPARADSPGR